MVAGHLTFFARFTAAHSIITLVLEVDCLEAFSLLRVIERLDIFEL